MVLSLPPPENNILSPFSISGRLALVFIYKRVCFKMSFLCHQEYNVYLELFLFSY
jgi:hypothetical protein